MPKRNATYLLTMLPGLEAVAAEEVSEQPNVQVRHVLRGKIIVSAPDFLYDHLRCADNVYALMQTGDMGPTRAALSDLTRQMAPGAFTACGDWQGQRFIINASVAGRHNYSRFEAAEACGAALTRLGMLPGAPDSRDKEYRLDIADGAFIFSEKLTDATFRYRGTARVFTTAALRPTVAAALVRLSRPAAGDVFVDPFCGSGSIICERAFFQSARASGSRREQPAPAARIMGMDVNPEALDAARRNTQGMDVSLHLGDFRQLPWPDEVHAVVTNPPWGGQIAAGDADTLYADFLAKSRAVLSRDGRMVVLTPLADALTKAAVRHGFRAEHLHTVSLHGKLARVYLLS